MSVPVLDVKGLTASYGKKRIIEALDLQVVGGEIFGLVGMNGAGKTTMIKAVLGLGRAWGDIRIFGQPAGPPNSRADLAYLPERFQPSILLKGWEFLELTLAYYGLRVNRDEALSLCADLDLDGTALDRNGRTYSKGMGQKLGLIATLLTKRPFLILDEPMSGLDPRARILLKERLLEFRRAGNTVFFSSHILSDIEEVCDRVAVMHKGMLVYVGDPAEFVTRFGGKGLERAFLVAIDNADKTPA
jgi:ABC-2 type transport system ATP-binding protein